MTYQEALDYVASLAPRGWRLGLDRMREFAHRAGLDDALGSPGGPQFIHIAGTNGKGSTAAYVQSILHESGYRVGSFFSPYVYDPRERIQLGREYIPEGIFAGLATMLEPLAEEFTETEFGGISEFEFKAAMGFMFYKRLQCEWVALEVGLGGRLDATNIVTPQCSVITSIGLDHTNVLGTTLEEIAFEKAGVIKPGVPLVVGEVPQVAAEVIEREATKQEAEVWRYGREIQAALDAKDGSTVVTTPHGRHGGLMPGIPGSMQSHNMVLAVAACDAARATRTLKGLQRGTELARIPGRFEVRQAAGKTVILDGAHNSDAAKVLVESLQMHVWSNPAAVADVKRRVLLVTGMVAGHDPAHFYRDLAPIVDEALVVPIDFHRGLPPAEVALALQPFILAIRTYVSVEEGVAAALGEAGPDDIVLITGSFYLLGEVDKVLKKLDP